MIILIGGQKGGTGKSTISTNLAALMVERGEDVLLVDTDPQGSSSTWSAIRQDTEQKPITVVQKTGRISRDLVSLSERYGVIIVDAGGRDSQEMRQAMGVADVMYSPLQASQFDVSTLETLAEVASAVNALRTDPLPIFIVLNRASPNPLVSEYKDARGIVAEYDCFQTCSTVIHERIAFRTAASDGLAVHEMRVRDSKAVSEMSFFLREVLSHGNEEG